MASIRWQGRFHIHLCVMRMQPISQIKIKYVKRLAVKSLKTFPRFDCTTLSFEKGKNGSFEKSAYSADMQNETRMYQMFDYNILTTQSNRTTPSRLYLL